MVHAKSYVDFKKRAQTLNVQQTVFQAKFRESDFPKSGKEGDKWM